MRPYGISFNSSARLSGVFHAGALIGVRIAPGATEFTRIFIGASSCASDCISSDTPPFEAA